MSIAGVAKQRLFKEFLWSKSQIFDTLLNYLATVFSGPQFNSLIDLAGEQKCLATPGLSHNFKYVNELDY